MTRIFQLYSAVEALETQRYSCFFGDFIAIWRAQKNLNCAFFIILLHFLEFSLDNRCRHNLQSCRESCGGSFRSRAIFRESSILKSYGHFFVRKCHFTAKKGKRCTFRGYFAIFSIFDETHVSEVIYEVEEIRAADLFTPERFFLKVRLWRVMVTFWCKIAILLQKRCQKCTFRLYFAHISIFDETPVFEVIYKVE